MAYFEDLKQKEKERLDLQYDLFCKSWLSFEEYSKKQDNLKIHIDLKNKQRINKLKTIKKEPKKETSFFDRKFNLYLWNKKEYSFYECLDIWFENCKNI